MSIFGPANDTPERNPKMTKLEMEIAQKIKPIFEDYFKNMADDFFLSVKLAPKGGLTIKSIDGKFSTKHDVPVIENIVVYDSMTNKMALAKLGFIDTGATNTIISHKIVKELGIAPERIKKKKRHVSAIGEIEIESVDNITVKSTEIDFNPINFVMIGTINEYDIAIGNDTLANCQFFYEGLTKTYVLKSFI